MKKSSNKSVKNEATVVDQATVAEFKKIVGQKVLVVGLGDESGKLTVRDSVEPGSRMFARVSTNYDENRPVAFIKLDDGVTPPFWCLYNPGEQQTYTLHSVLK